MTREDMVRLLYRCDHSITMSLREYATNDGLYTRTVKVCILVVSFTYNSP